MAHMGGPWRKTAWIHQWSHRRGPRGLGGGGPPVAGRGAAWALSGVLATRPGAGPVGAEPRALVPWGRAPHLSPVLPHPSVVRQEVLSYSAAPEPRFPTPLKVGAAFESLVKGVRRL